MVHKPIAIMILPLALAGILILAVVTAIPSNNHAFAFGNSFTFASPTSSDESSNAGNGQESSNAGNGQESSNENNATSPSGSTPNNATSPSGSTPNNATSPSGSTPNNATSPSGSTANNVTSPSGFTQLFNTWHSPQKYRYELEQIYNIGYDAGYKADPGAVDSCEEWFNPTKIFSPNGEASGYCHKGFVAGQHDKETGKSH
jgi:hypothetical protein